MSCPISYFVPGAFVANDPYMGEKIFARMDIWKWNWGLGQPREMET
jgi:hypothetical protein